jgi:hypothetical protein
MISTGIIYNCDNAMYRYILCVKRLKILDIINPLAC